MRKIFSKIILLLLISKISFSQNNCLKFDGTNDDVVISNSSVISFSIDNVFSIETWFKTTSTSAVLISNKSNIAPYVGYELALDNGKVVFELTNNQSTSNLKVETMTTTFNDGNWHHVACIYKGVPTSTSIEIYVDGTAEIMNVLSDNLLTSITSATSVRLGSRNGTAFFSQLEMDEVRFWTRALCAEEIVARMNCHLTGNEYKIEAYYNFNQGVASGNNSTVTTLIDGTSHNHTGTLNNFALTGTSSNWVSTGAVISGTCGTFGNLTVTGSTLICTGNTTSLTANGSQLSYTWMPTFQTGSVIAVNPTVTTTYTALGTTTANCLNVGVHKLSVSNCASVGEMSGGESALQIYPNPFNDYLRIDNFEDELKIEIADILGKIVLKETVKRGEMVNTAVLQNGIYFIKVNSENKTHLLIKN